MGIALSLQPPIFQATGRVKACPKEVMGKSTRFRQGTPVHTVIRAISRETSILFDHMSSHFIIKKQ